MTTLSQALSAWGDYDRDNPFPLFEQVRQLGPVHAVTLADGHDAWLIVGHTEARAALGDPRLSKDMHAALAADGDVVAEGLPGPAFARHMLVVDPPDHTRLRRLVASAFSVRRIEALRPRVQAIVDDLLDDIAAHAPDDTVDLVATYAFPLPFTVICELLGVPGPERGPLGRGAHAAARADRDLGGVRARQAGVRYGRRAAGQSGRAEARCSRRCSRQRVDQCTRRRRAPRSR